jgi:hypothetical protein
MRDGPMVTILQELVASYNRRRDDCTPGRLTSTHRLGGEASRERAFPDPRRRRHQV